MLAGLREERSSSDSPGVRVYTLGSFRVLVAGKLIEDSAWRRKTARQFFKVLLTRPGRRMTRDEVIELFWPDSDPEAASTNLRSTMHALRRALERPNSSPSASEVVSGDHTSVWLPQGLDVSVDADVFEQKVAQAWRSADPLLLLEEASALYEGDYLPDDLYEDWAVERREALKRTWTELQFGLAQALEAHADVTAAKQPLERLLRSDPCDERAAQELMRLLARHGRRAEALRVYQRLVQSLREELDVTPSSETLELHRHINSGAPLAPRALPQAAFQCTYPFPAPVELIGREAELTALLQVLAGGRTAGSSALIAAPAGTGKSALLGQVVRQAQAQDVLCLAGGGYEERGAVPLGPFHDALVDFLLARPPDYIQSLLGRSVDDLALVIPELRYHLQLTSRTASEPAALDRMRAFGAVHACLRGLAERGPVLVCLEDLHAADEATLQLLHYLARQTRRLPLVLLGTYRSDEARPDQPLAQTVAAMVRERLTLRITPSSLGRDDTDRLVTTLLEGSPSQALSESLYATTGGNPLFVEQLVLALGEAGQLRRRGGQWDGVGELRGAPHIVREVIAQRLHRLEPSCREVLAMASVLGQSFEHKVLLAAVEPLDEPALLRDVDRAIAAQVLQDTPGGYAFRHALVREAVYWDLTAPRRMLLHARAGRLLEQHYGARAEDHSAQLAHQFALAGDSREVRVKALQYSVAAGRRAAALSSFPEALAQFNRASEILEKDGRLAEPSLHFDVLSGRGLAESAMARYPESIATYRQALALSNDPIERGRAHKIIAFSFIHTGAFDAMIEECEAGLAEVRDLQGDDATEIRTTLRQLIGAAWMYQGHFKDVVRLGHQIESDTAGAEPGPRLLAHWVIAWGHTGLGQVEQAIEHYELAVAEGERWGDKIMLATCFDNLGHQEYLGGRFAAAREHLGRSLAIYRESASELRAVNALHNLCRVWVAEGEHDRASEQILRALELEMEGQERRAADAHHILGTIQMLRAEWTAACSSFEQALVINQRAGVVPATVDALVALGRVAQSIGRLQEAADRFAEALELSRRFDPSPLQVLAARYLGQLHLLAGDPHEAAAYIEEALSLAETMPETLEYAPTVLAAAELEANDGHLDAAVELAIQAADHARPLEQQTEAQTVIADLYLATGNAVAALRHVADAIALATKLGSPHHLSRAHLVSARATAMQQPSRADTQFHVALEHAEKAGLPLECARVLSAYAQHLRQTGTQLDLATSMQADSLSIAQSLRFSSTPIRLSLR